MPGSASSFLRRASLIVSAGTVASILVAAFGTTLGTEAGCASQETTGAPDASPAPCDPGPFMFGCNVVSADEPGCNTDDGTSIVLTRLPRATRYGVDCVANLVGSRDEQGDCKLDAVCKCLVTMTPAPSTDASAEEDAAPPSSKESAPAWNCSPSK